MMFITDRIRKQMVQPDGLVAETLAPLAEQYGQETSAVNVRLNECIALLRRGLRSEAIQRATMKPDVLDWSARLDFPELEDWLSILQFYGISAPELLDRDAAQQIQEAMVEVQSLEQLLRQHRRLAIAKAPLPWRLKVLRSLAKADYANVVWREDQEQWERVRLKQIPQELKEAADSRNVSAIKRLAAELNDAEWSIDNASDLGKRASELVNNFDYEDRITQLRLIADRVHAAYGENDQHTLLEHRDAWNELCSALKRPPPQDLTDSVAPAFQWLDDRHQEERSARQHEDAIAALTSALGSSGTLEQIERSYKHLSSLPQETDPDLLQRARTRIKSLQQSIARKRRTKILISLATAAAIVIAIGLWQRNRAFQLAVADSVSRITTMLSEQKLTDAESLLEKLKRDEPKVVATPAMSDVITKVEQARQQENVRAERVSQAIAEAHNDDPTKIDILKLVAAERLATTATEKEATQAIRAVWEKHQQKINDDQFANIQHQISLIGNKLSGFEKLAIHEVPADELQSMITQIKKLESEYPRGAGQAASLITAKIQQINAMISNIHQSKQLIQKRQTALEQIRDSRSLDDYTTAIERYVDIIPAEDSIAQALAETRKESKLWKNVDTWNAFCTTLENMLNKGLAQKDLEPLLKSAKTLQNKFESLPGIDALDQLKVLGEGIEARSGELNSVVEELGNSIVVELVTLIESRGASGLEGKRLFMNYDARMQYAQEIGSLRDASTITLPTIGDALGAVTQHRFKGKINVVEEPRSSIKKIVNHFETDRDAFLIEWETQLNAAMRELADNNRMDALLKELILARMVKAARAGSATMKEAFQDLEQELIDTSARRETWFVESDFKTDLEPKLAQLLQNAIQASAKKPRSASEPLNRLAKQKFVWLGGILPDETGSLSLWYYRDDVQDGDIVILEPANRTNTQFNLQTIASVRDGKSDLKASQTALKLGRPLFWLQTQK